MQLEADTTVHVLQIAGQLRKVCHQRLIRVPGMVSPSRAPAKTIQNQGCKEKNRQTQLTQQGISMCNKKQWLFHMHSMHCDLISWGKKSSGFKRRYHKNDPPSHSSTADVCRCVAVSMEQGQNNASYYASKYPLFAFGQQKELLNKQSFWGDLFFTFMPRVGPFQHTIQQHLAGFHSQHRQASSHCPKNVTTARPADCYWHLHLQTSWPPRRPSSSVPETRSWATNHS